MMRAPCLQPASLALIWAALVMTGIGAPGFAAAPGAAPDASRSHNGASDATPPRAAALKTAAPSPQPEPAPPEPKNLEPLNAGDYTGILGKKIMGPDGKELGLVVDVLIDARGRPRAAIIDFGGFLGVGSRKIAVDWRLLQLAPGQPDWNISLNLGRAEIQGAPEYKPDATTNKMVGPPRAAPSAQTNK